MRVLSSITMVNAGDEIGFEYIDLVELMSRGKRLSDLKCNCRVPVRGCLLYRGNGLWVVRQQSFQA